MSQVQLFNLAADAILVTHVLFVLFVVFGLVVIFIGYFVGWHWVRNLKFRILHLLAIGVVVLQAWFGIVCPLTTFEMYLRERAGDAVYAGSFIQHWLQSILFYSAPEWVFIACYSIFGSLVLASWFVVRPNREVV